MIVGLVGKCPDPGPYFVVAICNMINYEYGNFIALARIVDWLHWCFAYAGDQITERKICDGP